MKYLTRKDELLLLAILKLEDNAYLVKLREFLNVNTTKKWSVGNIFVSLDRLERQGLINPKIGEPKAIRGGKAIKYYRVTDVGLSALRETKIVQDDMWDGLIKIVFNK